MPRWEGNAKGRLEQAALELFSSKGFSATTVSDIALRAGLTTRTFFRHFPDKREVLFANHAEPNTKHRQSSPLMPVFETLEAGLYEAAKQYDGQLDYFRLRQKVIASDEGLRERELRKRDEMCSYLIGQYRKQGFNDLSATLLAKTAINIFSTAVDTWIKQTTKTPLTQHIQEVIATYQSMFDGINLTK